MKEIRTLLTTASVNDVVYRVTTTGQQATVWRCRCNGLWRPLKEMPLVDFEDWAVAANLLGSVDGGHALLSDLVGKVPEAVDTE